MEQDRFWFRGAGRCSESWSNVRPVMCGADAPRVSSGVSRWMVAVSFLAAFRTCPAGLWSGAYGGRWIGVMRSSSRPGPWRPVNAFAWWNRALSGTTAILPASVSRWSRSSAPIVCQVSRFCSVGYGVTVLLVGERGRRRRTGTSSAGPRTVWCAALFRGLHAAGPGLVLQAAGPGWSRVPASGRGRVPPRPGSPHARPGPSASWRPASRPATPAPSSPSARPSQRWCPHRRHGRRAGPPRPSSRRARDCRAASSTRPGRRSPPGRPRPARPHRIRNSTGDPRNTAPSHDDHRGGCCVFRSTGSPGPTCAPPGRMRSTSRHAACPMPLLLLWASGEANSSSSSPLRAVPSMFSTIPPTARSPTTMRHASACSPPIARSMVPRKMICPSSSKWSSRMSNPCVAPWRNASWLSAVNCSRSSGSSGASVMPGPAATPCRLSMRPSSQPGPWCPGARHGQLRLRERCPPSKTRRP